MIVTDKYVFFYGSIFSQWVEVDIVEGDNTFNTAEQYMMYHKAVLMGDHDIAQQIMDNDDPAKQKALGRKIKNWDQALWDANKYNIVLQGNILKFSQNMEALKTLLKFGRNRNFVEASPTDTIWGIGMGERDAGIEDPTNWRGQNLLGKVLDETYQKLRSYKPSKAV